MSFVLVQDVKFGLRLLWRSPGFAIVAVSMLALGIGANTAIFSVTRAAVNRSLPVPDPQQLVVPKTSDFPGGQTGYGGSSLTEPEFEMLRQQGRVFSDLVGFVPVGIKGAAARIGNQPEVVNADMVSGNYFSGLGARFALGHGFNRADEDSHSPIAVIGYGYWSRRFARNPAVLGQTLYLKEVPFTIVGVAGPGFYGFEPSQVTDVWIPFQDRPELPPWGQPGQTFKTNPHWWYLLTVGRLRPGVSAAQAEAALQPIFLRTAYLGLPQPEKNPAHLTLTPARGLDALNDSSEYTSPLRLLTIMVAVVLAIACANLALLLMARNDARQREFQLRLALGAGVWRMARQLLTESALLAGAGAALGWGFALWATHRLARWEQLDQSLAPDVGTLLFTIALAAGAAVAFGAAPLRSALASRKSLARSAAAIHASQSRRQVRFGRAVAVAQVALSLALFVGAGLLVRSLRNLEHVDLGVRSQGLLVFGVTVPPSAATRPARLQFFRSLLDGVRTLPGVESATILGNRLGSGWSNNTNVLVDGASPLGLSRGAPLRWNAVGAGYFATLGQPLDAGRDFTWDDVENASRVKPTPDGRGQIAPPTVAVVNRFFVQRYLHGRPALGHQVSFNGGVATIIGVAADSRYSGVDERPRPMAWLPYGGGASTMQVELRTTGDPQSAWPEVRRALQTLAPAAPMEQPMTQAEQWQQSYLEQTLVGRLGMFFGGLAALLVITGLYGTLAYKVSGRTAEIGVRMALGAARGRILWMVLSECLWLGLFGLLLGAPLAWAGARFVQGLLFGVRPNDWPIYAASAATLLAIAIAAGLVPARRAASINPLAALRGE